MGTRIGRRFTRTSTLAAAVLLTAVTAAAQENADCLACHSDPDMTGTRGGKEISVFVDETAFAGSVHAELACVACHRDLAGAELPHADDLQPVDCGSCHKREAGELRGSVHGRPAAGGEGTAATCRDCHGNHAIQRPAHRPVGCVQCHSEVAHLQGQSLHGQAAARGDKLAPTCLTCHGSHSIRSHLDPTAPTAVMNVPALCGQCHKEGTAVSELRNIPQGRILENYVDSIHGEGLYKKGLTVTAVCTSCHTSHDILPHTDPRSSIAAGNVVATCTQCHGQIEQVHRKVIAGKLWETRRTRSRCAWTATSRTRSARSSTRRAWPTPTA